MGFLLELSLHGAGLGCWLPFRPQSRETQGQGLRGTLEKGR